MTVVRAAGGVVVRREQVLLVHRPKYDDWTFPKGKLEEGETDDACALREVHEETGLRCSLERELGTTEYADGDGRPKRVRWWLMRPLDGEFVPRAEVDAIQWATRAAAAELLSYPSDLVLLARLDPWPTA